MKNWLPLVLGPALAMLSRPGFSCFSWKFSSGNVLRRSCKSFATRRCGNAGLQRCQYTLQG